MGRPTKIGEDTYSYTKDGRLVSIIKDGETITYNYDTQGIRRSKAKNGEETTYITKGKQILQEREGNNVITYLYNLNKVMGFVYNGSTYLYERNILGDIIRIYDEEGNMTKNVSFNYDGLDLTRFTYYNSQTPNDSAMIVSEFEDGVKKKETVYSSDYKIQNTYIPEYKDGQKSEIKILDKNNNLIETLQAE